MSELDRITLWQDDGSQKHWPGSNDTARLVTASPDLPRQADHFAHTMPPASFARSGSLRVQWGSTTLAWRLFTLNA
jgi:hypothetical protein